MPCQLYHAGLWLISFESDVDVGQGYCRQGAAVALLYLTEAGAVHQSSVSAGTLSAQLHKCISHACAVCGCTSEAMTDDPKFYNLEEVEDLARKVLPKAVSISMLFQPACLFWMTNMV